MKSATSDQLLDRPLSVDILHHLAQGSLCQDLPKAMRLWIILHSIYGDPANEQTTLDLPETFSYADWRDRFFTQTSSQYRSSGATRHHVKRDQIPEAHDPNCRCALRLDQWLFGDITGLSVEDESEWWQVFQTLYPELDEIDMRCLLTTGMAGISKRKHAIDHSLAFAASNRASEPLPPHGRRSLPDGRLFAITGKQLQNHFKDLVQRRWLNVTRNSRGHIKQFHKISHKDWPQIGIRPSVESNINPENLIDSHRSPDIVDGIREFAEPINGIQRSFSHQDYIPPEQRADQVQDLYDILKQCWQQDPVPPIRLTYRSARISENAGSVSKSIITVPVRLDFIERAYYLYAYGEMLPNLGGQDKALNWYDYRIDKIEHLEPLTWSHPAIPPGLLALFEANRIPGVDELTEELRTWGYDLYREECDLLLRFEPVFFEKYVRDTNRMDILREPISAPQVRNIIQASGLNQHQKRKLLQSIQRCPDYIYCFTSHRLGDNNIKMRLRRWSGNVEVLLPWDLRSQMIQDIRNLLNLYEQAA